MQKLVLSLLMLAWAGALVSAADPRPSFEQRVAQLRSAAQDLPPDDRIRPFSELQKDFPLQWDWILQDCPDLPAFLSQRANADIERQMLARVFGELADAAAPLRAELAKLADAPPTDPRWLNLYTQACQLRRAQRLRSLRAKHRQIVFTKHFNLGGSHYAYTEGQSDAQNERTFRPGTALCILDLTTPQPTIRTLIDDPKGVIRDPEVSHDGQRILFAWKKSDHQDDYHLYDLTLATGAIRQLTEGLGFADYEPAYLPNGDIIFNSTRCVQTVDCWWTEVSNLYTCDKDGRFMRRLTFDQVHDNYPRVLDDGRVIYTRWEYNDRGQLFVQSLFQMRPDGTSQMELYGNNSWFPTSILHARGIPGTNKIIGIASGHHSFQAGKLILIDPTRGRQENTGAQLIAPVRPTPAERIDAYGQDGELFAHPYPISDREFLVTYHPTGWDGDPTSHPKFGIYLMTIDGQRELLASDPRLSCNQPVPLSPRRRPAMQPSIVDYRKATGTYYVQDIYAGPGLAGVSRGTVKQLRIVALDYRAASIGENGNAGPAGGALVSTPPAIDNASWDVKIILGQAKVHADGSAFFQVPARTPLYFQAVDADGRVVQTMRSWSTLQPGESASCIGCHEDKNAAPPSLLKPTLAARAGAQKLDPFYGPPRAFSFKREIQPILDAKCTSCHNDRTQRMPTGRRRENAAPANPKRAFSLLADERIDEKALRHWSDAYLSLTNNGHQTKLVNWVNAQSAPPMLPPYHAGSARSAILPLLEKGHYDVKMTRRELDLIACWIDLLVPYCGDYTESNAWSDDDARKYAHFLAKRRRMEQIEKQNIESFLARQAK